MYQLIYKGKEVSGFIFVVLSVFIYYFYFIFFYSFYTFTKAVFKLIFFLYFHLKE